MNERVLKILIADDEPGVIQLIRQLIAPELPVHIIAEASNGKEAYEKLVQLHPDIVITDIRMPGMSGMEFVEKAKEHHLQTEFILVSGYKDFDYARSAIRLGVADYLIKPIEQDELNRLIQGICDKHQHSSQIQEKLALAEEKLARHQSFLRKEFLLKQADCLERQISPENMDSYTTVFLQEEGYYQAVILKLDSLDVSLEALYAQKNAERLSAFCAEKIAPYCRELEIVCVGSRAYLLLNFLDNIQKQRIQEVVCEWLQQQNTNPQEFTLTAAIGGQVPHLLQFFESMLTADQMLWERLRQGSGRFLLYRRENAAYFREPEEAYEIRNELQKGIFLLNSQLVEQTVFCHLQKIQAQGTSVYALKNQAYRILDTITGIIRANEPNCPLQEPKKLIEQLDLCVKEVQIPDLCVVYCRNAMEVCIQYKSHGISLAVKEVQRYLTEHYREEVNLDKIASQIGFTGAYISTIFKKETGMTLTNYLIDLRLERAKELIRTTNLTINEVAHEVGYMDTRHFSKLFIKTVGIKPIEYRKFYANYETW